MTESPSKRSQIVTAFADSKVGTCMHVMAKNGHTVAVPFHSPNSLDHPQQTERRSMSHEVHRVRNLHHAGMLQKPLQPYSPLAQRSRLKTQGFVVPYKNSSTVVIGDRRFKDRRQFLTMAQNMMKVPDVPLTTNPGIISEKNRWKKYKEWL